MPGFNLLYPPSAGENSLGSSARLTASADHDLGIDQVVAAFSEKTDYQKEIREIFSVLICDPAVIRFRQEILLDLLHHPGLVKGLSSLLPVIDSLSAYSFHPEREMNTLHEVSWRIGELQCIIDCIEGLDELLVDNIFTHFPLEERPETDAGRFGEEAMRLGKIFEKVTGNSLVLLNESLSNTSFGESLYLAQDIVRILRRVGLRAIYSTHLLELANRVEQLNQSVAGESPIISLVSSAVEEDLPDDQAELRRSYKVAARPPLGQSYAREVAGRHGIRYEQLEKILTERGVI